MIKEYYITGGAGSLGCALIEHILKNNLGTVRVIDSDASQLQVIEENWDVDCIYCDISDCASVSKVLKDAKFIIHCAALKYIPMCEKNPMDAVLINITGSDNIIKSSKTKKLIAISSDKAVSPSNVYGATKLIMERMFLASGYSCVRFGNFWESRGSVIPILKEQDASTGVLTITDPEMTRFWIGLDEAAGFVVKCIREMKGGEIFVPKMREQSILSIANEINPMAEIKVIGRRQGEKLKEDLFFEFEQPVDKGTYYLIDYN